MFLKFLTETLILVTAFFGPVSSEAINVTSVLPPPPPPPLIHPGPLIFTFPIPPVGLKLVSSPFASRNSTFDGLVSNLIKDESHCFPINLNRNDKIVSLFGIVNVPWKSINH